MRELKTMPKPMRLLLASQAVFGLWFLKTKIVSSRGESQSRSKSIAGDDGGGVGEANGAPKGFPNLAPTPQFSWHNKK